MHFFYLKGLRASRHTGDVDGTHRWKLPGVRCPACKATWSNLGLDYPSVELTSYAESAKLEHARLETDFAEFERLRDGVRPLVPGGLLTPGTGFGPLQGSAHGTFGPFCLPVPWSLMMRLEALERLQAAGLQGLKGCRVELRFRQKKSPPELVELELLPSGMLHDDCTPPAEREACARCGRVSYSLPERPILERGSLPRNVALFRLASFTTVIIATERFVETARQLWPEEDFILAEMPVR